MAERPSSCAGIAPFLLILAAATAGTSAQTTLESLQRDLAQKQREARQKGLVTMEEQKKILAEQAERVRKFLESGEAKGLDAHNGRLYLHDLYFGLGDRAHAKEALLRVDVDTAPAHVLTRAAFFGKRLGLEKEPTQWIDAALAKATSFDDRLAVAKDLATVVQEPKRAEAVFQKALEDAKDDQQKAKVLWFRAQVTREREDVEEEAYLQALADLSAKLPDTYYGSIAKDRLRAKELKPGSDPIALGGTDLDGKPVKLADWQGKVLIVDFWGTWCQPCVEVHERLKALRTKHKDGLEVLGVALDRDPELVAKVAADRKLAWRQVCDGKGIEAELALRWNVGQVPCLFVIGKDGKLVAQQLAPLDRESAAELEKTVEGALK